MIRKFCCLSNQTVDRGSDGDIVFPAFLSFLKYRLQLSENKLWFDALNCKQNFLIVAVCCISAFYFSFYFEASLSILNSVQFIFLTGTN